jgi:O6-methylguanine-DNA--protein-cysteine methyltransferase
MIHVRLVRWPALFCLLAGLALAQSGCLGAFFPTSIDVELKEETPLKAPVPEIRRIAVVLPSVVEALLNVPDPSRGKLDRVALDIAGRLEESERVKIVSADQFRAALADLRPEADSLKVALTDADPWGKVYQAARRTGAEAVLVFEGQWESPLTLGDTGFGRSEFKRQVGMALVDAGTGHTIWYQKAAAEITEGMVIPQEPPIRRAVASALTTNLLRSIK